MTVATQRNTWLRAALGGREPLPWQDRLLSRMERGDLPCALDLPTGLGKTSVMAIWLVARALGAPVPRRLVYVVDRRAVVDQATEVASELRELVDAAPQLRDALGLEGPLPISTLRGQFADNRRWLADPCAPAIIVGTVDMVGSRLLFEGYGVSRRMRPFHAGMLGADTLLALDEAHLVPPFERLVTAIANGAETFGPVQADLIPALRVMSLSATGSTWDQPLVLDDADRAHDVVKQRLGAAKHLVVRDPVEQKGLVDRLADEAWELCHRGSRPARCLVFTNGRLVAQQVRDALVKRTGCDVGLFVGARRVFERQAAASWLRHHGFLAGSSDPPDKPVFLVATAAAEVGVDLDATHMVCDVVAWERMVQRLGRVNRRGTGTAQIVVVSEIRKDDDRTPGVLALLDELPVHDDGSRDVSPGALVDLKAGANDKLLRRIAQASTTPPLHPPLTRAVVESWSMTSLEEHTGRPDVAPWIRGWIEDDVPQVKLVFRSHLPIDATGQLLPEHSVEAYLEAAPPHLKEVLETDTSLVVKWLDSRRKRLAKNRRADDETAHDIDDLSIVGLLIGRTPSLRRPITLGAVAGSKKDLERDLAGGTLLLDARIGGLTDGLLDDSSDEATDVGELDENGARALPFSIVRSGEPMLDDDLREEARIPTAWHEGDETEWLLIGSLREVSAESEDGRSVAPRRAQLLDEHQAWTETIATELAQRLGLPEPLARTLKLAARLHDEGKRAHTWQRAFGVREDQLKRGEVYGKTTSRPNLALLARYRHEFGSLPRAEEDPRMDLPPDLRELCLHLIAAHHGFARPLIRTDGAEGPPSTLTHRAREVALRFSHLERTWGPWGLAWLEVLLRAADQQASRRNDEEGARG
ncbi:MAG: type I-U CRISPR-associated helicase/endonuclease Cas3 [Planctomycetota bacterium]